MHLSSFVRWNCSPKRSCEIQTCTGSLAYPWWPHETTWQLSQAPPILLCASETWVFQQISTLLICVFLHFLQAVEGSSSTPLFLQSFSLNLFLAFLSLSSGSKDVKDVTKTPMTPIHSPLVVKNPGSASSMLGAKSVSNRTARKLLRNPSLALKRQSCAVLL